MLLQSFLRVLRRGTTKQLYLACCNGNLSAIQEFFRSRPESALSHPYFRTLAAGHPKGLYDEHSLTLHGDATCLHVCAWKGHIACVSWLLAQGANLLSETGILEKARNVAHSGSVFVQAWKGEDNERGETV